MARRNRTTTRDSKRGGSGARIVSEGGKVPARVSPDDYVRRRTEVEKKDHEEFQGYLADKKAAEARKAPPPPTRTKGVSRRTMFMLPDCS